VQLPERLAALQALRARGVQVVLADGGSQDGSVAIAQASVDQLVRAPRGRARQMNAGARIAKGDVLMFLHIDTLLPAMSPQFLLQALTAGRGYAWGRFDVLLSGSHPAFRVIETMMNLRSRLTGIATGDQAMFVRRPAFEQAGRFAEIPLMEDVRLSKVLRAQAGDPLCLRERVQSSSRRWEKHGILRTVVLMWWLRLAYVMGVAPEYLHKLYYPQKAFRK
jgi:rSAM/selenodomain-associated transferase 2